MWVQPAWGLLIMPHIMGCRRRAEIACTYTLLSDGRFSLLMLAFWDSWGYLNASFARNLKAVGMSIQGVREGVSAIWAT